MTKIYSVLIGESFETIMKQFNTDSVKHFAEVQINKNKYDFILLDKDVFGTNDLSYAFIRKDLKKSDLVYSNLTEEQITQVYMYTLFMNNDLLANPDDYFGNTDTEKLVKKFRASIDEPEEIPTDVTIHYEQDHELITKYPTLKFPGYILDYNKLENLFNIKFEQHHINFFSNLKPLKDAFQLKKEGMSTVNELREHGIYILPVQYESMVDSIKNKEHILFSGPTGSGKSTILFHMLRTLDLPHVVIECNASKKYSDLFGSLTLRSDRTLAISLGKVSLAYRDGMPLVLEEFTALDDELFKTLLTCMQHDELYLELDAQDDSGQYTKDIVIKRHPNFQVFATANEEKRYNVNALTPQVKRRFHTIVPINYLPADLEQELINQRLNNKELEVTKEVVEQIVTIGNTLRNKKMVVSTATLAIWAEKSSKYGVRTASICHFVPQIVFNQNDLKTVNDVFSSQFVNHEPIEIAI
jgi:MoxR-like ATPase